MKIVMDSMLRVQDAPAHIMDQIKAELTIKNPSYALKMAIGLNKWACGEEYIKLWGKVKTGGKVEYVLPRGYAQRLWEIIGHLEPEWESGRVKFPVVEFPRMPKLRDYQLPVLEKANFQGVIIAPCGSGKTEMGMAIAANLGQPTLWITHTMDLLKQSMDRAIKRLGLTGRQIGIIQGENMSIGSHMTFATVQTLARRDLSKIKNMFGCVIIDEAHLVFKDDKKFRMFADVINQLPALYRFGLTASEHRSDGLIETMFHIIGPKIYEVPQDDPRLNVMVPKVEFIETDFDYFQEDDELFNVQQMYRAMREDFPRNFLIGQVLAMRIMPDDCCLVLGDSLEHLENFKEYVADAGRTAAFVCGETPKKEREKIMEDMRVGKYQFLFATYALAKLGLDIPRLNKLVLITPHRDKTSVQQAVGRVMRPFEGKEQPIVYDIYDNKVPQLVRWARERVRVYKALGCEIAGGPKVRK